MNAAAAPTASTTTPLRRVGSSPSTNASSKTYLLFLSTCIFATMTTNFIHHHLADPHNIHKRANLKFHNQLRMSMTSSDNNTRIKKRLGGGGGQQLEKEVEEVEKQAVAEDAIAAIVAVATISSPHNNILGSPTDHSPVEEKEEEEIQQQSQPTSPELQQQQPPPQQQQSQKQQPAPLHDLSGLNCHDHNGPSNDLAAEMVYWQDIPSDSTFKSPIGNEVGHRKYLTFEPDGGGFNNARMNMETIVVMAHAMGRTLVLPPSQSVYLLQKDKKKQRVHFSFADFYHMEQIGYEHAGLDIISTEEFLLTEAMTGHLRNKTTGEVAFPPDNRTNWDGVEDMFPLKEYLRNTTLTPLDWDPSVCLAAFPSDAGPQHFEELNDMFNEAYSTKRSRNEYMDNPVAVDASPVDRLREVVSGLNIGRLCIYDQKMQAAPLVHFMCYHKMRVRMLTHFYAFLFFEDWRHDLWSKRFVRDHLRYADEIQCAAARVVAALRERSRSRGNINGIYDSFHIRRGDFQYKDMLVDANAIYNNAKEEIPDNSTVFVATDHMGKPFFQPLADRYDLVFLKDFEKELEGVNTNLYGMIDQLVASRGRVFFGCMHSTFTGFIFRMRGYHAQRDKALGWERGALLNSFYYTSAGDKRKYEQYTPMHPPTYSREFPTSWRDIDRGIEELLSSTHNEEAVAVVE